MRRRRGRDMPPLLVPCQARVEAPVPSRSFEWEVLEWSRVAARQHRRQARRCAGCRGCCLGTARALWLALTCGNFVRCRLAVHVVCPAVCVRAVRLDLA